MDSLDKKFRHSSWYKNEGLTVRQFLDKAANDYGTFAVTKVLSKTQSDNLFDDRNYCMALTDGRGLFRLDDTQYNYYVEKYNARVKEVFASEPETINNLIIKRGERV